MALTSGNEPVGVLLLVVAVLLASGIIVVQPNDAKAITFFGRYIGSIRDSGIWLTVPLNTRRKATLRVRNFDSKTLKVNDVHGNPVEIAAVVVFRVVDSAKALFDVEDYMKFVEIQSETALRHVTTKYPYDIFGEEGQSLRGNPDEVANELARELQERLAVAGVEVIEARLTHLAYATEIAHAMLQRQQASAINRSWAGRRNCADRHRPSRGWGCWSRRGASRRRGEWGRCWRRRHWCGNWSANGSGSP